MQQSERTVCSGNPETEKSKWVHGETYVGAWELTFSASLHNKNEFMLWTLYFVTLSAFHLRHLCRYAYSYLPWRSPTLSLCHVVKSQNKIRFQLKYILICLNELKVNSGCSKGVEMNDQGYRLEWKYQTCFCIFWFF